MGSGVGALAIATKPSNTSATGTGYFLGAQHFLRRGRLKAVLTWVLCDLNAVLASSGFSLRYRPSAYLSALHCPSSTDGSYSQQTASSSAKRGRPKQDSAAVRQRVF